MGKLLGMLMSLLAAVCIATVIAAAILVAYYARSWKVTGERFGQAIAILQGKSPESFLPPAAPKKENDSEQPAYDQVLAVQGLKTRDLEQRELTLRANMQQFQEELNEIAKERKRVQAVRDDLQAKLEEMSNTATSAGMSTVQETLEKLKPSKAKELIVQRLKNGETDVVAQLLANMSDSKRAKIIAEFKSDEDMKQIGDVLNRIRQGQPTADLIDAVGKKVKAPKGPGA